MKLWSYFFYLLRHKFFVIIAALRIGASLYHALRHDTLKLLNSDYDYTLHTKTNRHHWQYWTVEGLPLEIPDEYILDMVADWMGAARAKTGSWNIREWYEANKDKMRLHPVTRKKIEKIISA